MALCLLEQSNLIRLQLNNGFRIFPIIKPATLMWNITVYINFYCGFLWKKYGRKKFFFYPGVFKQDIHKDFRLSLKISHEYLRDTRNESAFCAKSLFPFVKLLPVMVLNI